MTKDWAGVRNADGMRIPGDEEMRKWQTDPNANRKPRGARTTRETYRYCKTHSKWKPSGHKCFLVVDESKRTDLNVPMIQTFEPYWCDTVAPKTHGGLPVWIHSKKQRDRLAKANGLIPVG